MLITKKCDNSDSIEAYIAATQNELEIDRVSMTQAGLDRDFPYVLPRAMLFAHYAKKTPKPFKLLFRGLTLFWWFPIFPGIVFIQAVRYSFLRGCKKKKNLNGASNIIIGTTHRVADVVLRLSESRRPHVWLIVPWIQLISVPQSDMQIQLLSLSQWSDFLWALNKTWQGARSFANQAYRKTDRLQTYTAFTWFLTWRVLSEHAHGTTSWWYANHYDRWAILIDSIQLHVKKIMLQHGLILDYLKIPNKLMNVDEFYFFDDKSREIFKMNVLSNHTSIQFKKLSTTINFTKLPLEPHFQKRILIIGQPISAEKECMLAEQLLHVK